MAPLPPNRNEQQPAQILFPEEMNNDDEEEEELMPWDYLLHDAHNAAVAALEAYMQGPRTPDGDGRVDAYVDTFCAYIREQLDDDDVELTDDESELVHEDARLHWIDHQWQECEDGLPVGFERLWPDQFDESNFFDVVSEDMHFREDHPIVATFAEVELRVVHILRRMNSRFPHAYDLVREMAIEMMQGDGTSDAVRARHLFKAIQLVEEEDGVVLMQE